MADTHSEGLSSPNKLDLAWPVDEWGIPVLDLELQARHVQTPLTKWGSLPRTARLRGTVHFYADDYRWLSLWDDPNPLVLSGAPMAVEPNFSTDPDMARAGVLFDVYRKRWLSRYWQDFDIQILVDLCVDRAFFDLALLGVPAGWRAYANRAYSADPQHLIDAADLAQRHAGSAPILYLVYGGNADVQALCQERRWLWFAEHQDTVRKPGRPAKTKTEEPGIGSG